MSLVLPSGPKGANRFPKSERMNRRKEIEACLGEGKRFRHQLLHIYVRWRGGEGRKIAFSVGKKGAKKATQRNRIRRQLREAYRRKRWALKEGFDLFVVAHPNCAVTNFQTIDKALTELLHKANLLASGLCPDAFIGRMPMPQKTDREQDNNADKTDATVVD